MPNTQNEPITAFRGRSFFLSNFFPSPIEYDELRYGNAEAAFQAQKCADAKDRAAFCDLSASDAKRAGRRVPLRHDWESVKVSVMEGVVHAKFSQNPGLAEALLNTGDAYLEEGNNWGDRTWGTVNGSGANLLGQILMKERDALKEREKDEGRCR